MSIKILFISDAHYGLKSAGFDRTEEINNIMTNVVEYADENDVDVFIHGGDLGHTANPSSEIHALWVDLFSKLDAMDIISYFMLGNHDVTNVGSEYGSLAPLVALGYESVEPVCHPIYYRLFNNRIGLMFLPYNSKNHLDQNLDECISRFVGNWASLMGQYKAEHLFVFTHLNPIGAMVNDDYILRPISAVVPENIIDLNPTHIFSGHIHKPQEISHNHWVVGSPICTDFGDTSDKRFLVIEILEDGTVDIESIPTKCTPLVKLDYDFVDKGIDFKFDENVVCGAGVKVWVRCTSDQREGIDLEGWKMALERAGAVFVRPIVPLVVRREERQSRVVEIGIDDPEVVRRWVEEKKPSNAGLVLECATEAMDNG